MVLKLYGVLPSPPVRAVLMCADVLDVQLELHEVNPFEMEHLKEDFIQKNPQHTIPVLEEEDGFTLADSHAIMAYLVAKYGKDDSLYPKDDYRLRAIIDQRLHFDSSTLFNHGLAVAKPLLYYGIGPTQDKIDQVKETLKIIDTILAKSKTTYIAGNSLSIADFSIVTSITSLDAFTPYADFPNIKSYVERIEKLPAYEINAKGLAIAKEFIEDALKKLI